MAEQNLIKVKGIVIRSVQFKESDKIITVLTAELGRISVYCHGAKSNKSKFLTPTRLFCYSEFVLTRKKDFYYIKEADYIEAFFNIVNSMDKLFLGQYFLEIIIEISVEGERHDSLLRLTLNSLYALSNDMAQFDVIKSAYELRVCVETGLSPYLLGCRECGIADEENVYFDVLNGNLVCKSCLLREENSIEERQAGIYLPATKSVIAAMQYVENTKLERLFSFQLTDDALKLFANITEKYLLNQVGKSFVTLDLYKDQIKS